MVYQHHPGEKIETRRAGRRVAHLGEKEKFLASKKNESG